MKTIPEILSELPEWSDDWKTHQLFCSYDQDEGQEFIVSFWKRALTKIFDESLQGITANIEDLIVYSQRKGRIPTGLRDIIVELIKRGEILSIEELEDKVTTLTSSKHWKQWMGMKITNMWKKPIITTKITTLKKLKSFYNKIIKICQEKNRNSFTFDEMSSLIDVSAEDLRVLVNYMSVEGIAISYKGQIGSSVVEIVKIKQDDEELVLKPEDSAIIMLNMTISDIDKKVNDLNETKDFLHRRVLAELKEGDKIKAKHYLIRKKMIEKKIHQMLGSRLNLEEQLLNITNSVANKQIVSSLATANNLIKKLAPDIREVSQVVDASKECIEQNNDISSILSENIGDINDDEIMSEFDSLETQDYSLPSVPNYRIESINTNAKEEKKVILNS